MSIEEAASSNCVLVEFRYEDPETIYRYAAYDTDVTFDGNVFTALPTLEAEMPELDGTTRPSEMKILMTEVPPVSAMRTTHPPTIVTVWDISPPEETTAYKQYKGEVSKCQFSHNGRESVVQVSIGGPKRRLQSSVSMKLGRFCDNTFGIDAGGGCEYDREATKDTAVIDSVSGTRITVSSLTTLEPALRKSGSLRYRGFEIPINYQESLTVIHVTKPIPTHWIGKTVDVLDGCDKTLGACTLRGQVENHAAIGRKIPARDIRTSQ